MAGERQLLEQWLPALQDGLSRADARDADIRRNVGMAFYGDLFRPSGRTLVAGDRRLEARDVEAGFEADLLAAWWQEAARTDPAVAPPDGRTLARAPGSAQAALRALSRSRFFAGVALRAMVSDLKQVRRYLDEPAIRVEARHRVTALITGDTQVVVAHSLGSVVAYEALCEISEHDVRAFVTIGSPLGIRNLIFDRLYPSAEKGVGVWPGSAALPWTNIADDGDVVALVKDLRPTFGERVNCQIVVNGSHAHDSRAYLSDRLTGAAVAAGLL
jgi:hypothetical protein